MNEPVTVFGIRIEIIVIVLLVLFIVLAVALFFNIRRLEFVNRKYYTIMSGKKGKDLEKIVLSHAVSKHIQRKILTYKNKTIIFS